MSRLFNLFAILFLATAFHAKAQFITVWKTDNAGTSASNQIKIPAIGTNYNIAWEQVGNPANKGTATGSGQYTLTFPEAGTYQISITPGSGTFNQIRFFNLGDQKKLLTIKQWGSANWTNMDFAYNKCSNLTIEATDIPDLHAVKDMRYMFYGCVSLATIPNINEWDVSGVQNMNSTFDFASKFNGPIGDWNVANVTNMSSMFISCSVFNQSLENWDTRNVENMEYMFAGAVNFNQPIGSWNTSKVTNMFAMFEKATNFNQPLSEWDVSSVTDMAFMFNDMSFNQPIGNWNVGKVTIMHAMFQSNPKFNQPLENWDVSNVADMMTMFSYATSFNQPLAKWDVHNVINIVAMLRNSAFNQPIGDWEIRKVTDMSGLLNNSAMDCASMTQTLQGWAANIATTSNIFFGASGRPYGSEGAAALKILRENKNWNITIGSQVACSALDVSLIRFDAHQEAGKVKLEWATANEADNDYFEIERSENAVNWQVVNRIKGAGTVNSAHNYSVTDPEPLAGTMYYRLKYVDFSGIAGYSRIRAIKMDVPASHDLYPNPATTSITISGKPEGHLKMYNLSGLEVMQTEIKAEKQQISVGQLPAGTYIIKMDDGWNTKYIKR